MPLLINIQKENSTYPHSKIFYSLRKKKMIDMSFYSKYGFIFNFDFKLYINILKKSSKERVSNVDNITINKIICTRGYSKDICVFLRFPLFFWWSALCGERYGYLKQWSARWGMIHSITDQKLIYSWRKRRLLFRKWTSEWTNSTQNTERNDKQ